MDRRPIAARQTSWAVRLAESLARSGITPNAISVWGMIFGIGAGLALASTRTGILVPLGWLGGAGLVALRLLANMLDGMVAERQKSHSALGSLFNELPDRVSDAATLVGFGYALHSSPELGWLAALLAVLTAYLRAQLVVSGAPQDFGGPMAKPHRMAVIIAASILMAVVPLTMIPKLALAIIVNLSIVTVWLRLARGAKFLRKGGS